MSSDCSTSNSVEDTNLVHLIGIMFGRSNSLQDAVCYQVTTLTFQSNINTSGSMPFVCCHLYSLRCSFCKLEIFNHLNPRTLRYITDYHHSKNQVLLANIYQSSAGSNQNLPRFPYWDVTAVRDNLITSVAHADTTTPRESRTCNIHMIT